uniref:Uncharacterized protein n=1 Tax=Rhizophora mucronata TaxID=61149 RepID=A0A2P2IK13_RHIMU
MPKWPRIYDTNSNNFRFSGKKDNSKANLSS